ncbi:MAG: hypothetical protein DI562_02110 [Stenotrophomonas acidaminiphila]|nr:MAG: hypothetical protein DI562_02110 [Stenotrophomonas acidaminiphila]
MFAALLHVKRAQHPSQLDRLIYNAFPLFRKQPAQGHEQLLAAIGPGETWDMAGFVQALLEADVVLASPTLLESRAWLAPDGNYSFDFQERCLTSETYEVVFSDLDEGEEEGEDQDEVGLGRRTRKSVRLQGPRDQQVVASIVASAPGERITVEAYAGTGKSFLLHALRDSLPGGFTVVAPQAHQGIAFRSHIAANASVQFLTLAQLANDLTRRYSREAGLIYLPRVGPSEYSLDEQARMAGIHSIAGASEATVVSRLYDGINAWCNSEDPDLSDKHFHRSWNFRGSLSEYVIAGERLWKAMFDAPPRKGQAFSVWNRNIAKWLEQKGTSLPARRGTLLVDEAHDLPPAWRRLFDNYQGGCILLGDPHQRLRGRASASHRGQSTQMTTSLRTGVQAVDLIERTLRLAPEREMEGFRSSRDHITRLHRYSDTKEIPEEGLRLFGNEWAMLEFALRRANAGAPFSLLGPSRRLLEEHVRHALAMFSGRSVIDSLSVRGHNSWESLAGDLVGQGRGAIVRMFERGFEEKDLNKLLSLDSPQASVALGLIDHAKNQEHSVVALAPCCFEDAAIRRGFQPVHAAYLGMTRARNELWVPGEASDRLVELKAAFESQAGNTARR